jgi:hypothetical protein
VRRGDDEKVTRYQAEMFDEKTGKWKRHSLSTSKVYADIDAAVWTKAGYKMRVRRVRVRL